ncbi:hypothetical protein CONLIGDRAFT_642630 [Coniochaeta ligniaria NRRL 30616]|uniref:Uncharacterized protein n=1 Tax=Coniochaeta ligniaria NRRL 30616 TaxID=1408157 RepID=A0A1J7ISS0_9PEZI|nr:hypothetical protein CONLIGDRAFT_642630 [Coniochaeta ligniaria NRRL 30616]
MPRSKKKPGPVGVQWAPISTPDQAPMMPQPPPLAPMALGAPPTSTSGASASPSSEAPATSGQRDDVVRAGEPRGRPAVLPSNGPTSHHHHYIPTPTSSGRGTPTSAHPGASHGLPISNYGAGPSHGRPSPARDQPDPSSLVLPSIERSPDWTNGRRMPEPQRPPPPDREPFRFSKYSQPPRPPTLPMQQQQPPAPTLRSPSQAYHPPTASPALPPRRRSLNDDEVRRLQRFMSLNWRVGVINHPPFARRSDHGRAEARPVAGFVGQSQGFLGQRPR